MKVKVGNNAIEKWDFSIMQSLEYSSSGENKMYTVLGMLYNDNGPQYYICEERDSYPTLYPGDIFDLVDSRVSKYWTMTSTRDSGTRFSFVSYNFEEWHKMPSFYENLIDGGKEEFEIFSHYRTLMNLEFEENHILRLGIVLDISIKIMAADSFLLFKELTDSFGSIQKGWDLPGSFWSYQPNPSDFVKHGLGLVLFFDHAFDPNIYILENTGDLAALLLADNFPEISFFLTNESQDSVMYFDVENQFFFARGDFSTSLFLGET